MRTYLKSFLEAQSIVSFQDSATPVIEGIIDLHHNIFYYSIIITALVMWMLRQILVKYNYVWDFSKNSNDINEIKYYLIINNILFHLFLFFFLFCYTTIILYYMCFFDFFILYYNRYFVDKIIINLFLLISLICLYINFSKFNKSAFLCYFFSFIILFIKVNFLFSQMTVLSCLNISFFLYLSVTNINYYVYIYCMSNMKDKLPEKSIMKNSKFSRLFDNFKYILLFLLCEVFEFYFY